jgi:hypothetical protein
MNEEPNDACALIRDWHRIPQDGGKGNPRRGGARTGADGVRRPMDAVARRARPQERAVEGEHELFGFLTTEPNAVVAPTHASDPDDIGTGPPWFASDATQAVSGRMARATTTWKRQCFRCDRMGDLSQARRRTGQLNTQIAAIAANAASLRSGSDEQALGCAPP